MFRFLVLAGSFTLGACASSPNTSADRHAAGYALSEEAQEARTMFLEHAEGFLADPASATSQGWYNQTISMAGREDLLRLIPENTRWSPRADCLEGAPDVADEIVSLAARHTIVILNEDHAKPQHRVLIADIVRRLREAGFTHYAGETLRPESLEPRLSHTTLVTDGWYTQDPVYARLLEDIRASGMVLVAYEQRADQRLAEDAAPEDRIAAREEAQANNLVEAIFAKMPETRIIIHVGHAHVYEFAGDAEHVWMAARLKQKTGIDPLTVELTQCVPAGNAPVLVESMSMSGRALQLQTDLVMRFPEVTFTSHRPDYRRFGGAREVGVPEELRPVGEAWLVEARRLGDGDVAVPADRLYLQPGEDIPLILPAGDYDIAAFDKTGLMAGPVRISVTP